VRKPDLEQLLGNPADDPGCDAGMDLFDEYCEAVFRGEPLSARFSKFSTHLDNCAACREDVDSLIAALRDEKDADAG
jgi:hypothetical protein